jgi:acetate kinase
MVIAQPEPSYLLTINGGSSSLKFAVFPRTVESPSRALLRGRVERIGLEGTRAIVPASNRAGTEEIDVNAPDLGSAAGWLIDWLHATVGWAALTGIVHRVVHGGAKYFGPEKITPEVLDELRRISPMDPEHLPGEITVIEHFQARLPEMPQVACFDTAFHHDLPRVARIMPIPRRFEAAGVRRYGFHGLSYAYLMEALARAAGPEAAAGRVILAHLGNGASLAAVHRGRPIDTTMALTPAAGIVMSTRSGDIDPGLPGFLARAAGVSTEQFDAMINHESGLLGVSETSSDVRDLLAREDRDARAAEALALLVHSAKKAIGALAAALGGLDILVFSGGIGENAKEVRARICEGLGFLGITLDPQRNTASAAVISPEGGRVQVRIIPTDEESMMAREASGLLAPGPSAQIPPGQGVRIEDVMIETNHTADDLKKLPLRAIVAFAARCARRVERQALPPDDHPERERTASAIAEALRVAEDFARGRPCPTIESAVRAVEAGQAAAQGEITRENAYAAVVRAAHAAACATHVIAVREEPEEKRLLSPGPPLHPLSHLADLTADLAALDAYTAAVDAANATASTNDLTSWASDDYQKLLKLGLGHYPETGKPIDPSPEGPLGPLWPGTDGP